MPSRFVNGLTCVGLAGLLIMIPSAGFAEMTDDEEALADVFQEDLVMEEEFADVVDGQVADGDETTAIEEANEKSEKAKEGAAADSGQTPSSTTSSLMLDPETAITPNVSRSGLGILYANTPPGSLRIPPDAIKKVDVSATVMGSPDRKVLLSDYDLINVKFGWFKDPIPGQQFVIARREQFVEQPGWFGWNLGYVVRIVGTVELIEPFGGYWSGRILKSFDYVTKGDWLIPFETVEDLGIGEMDPNLVGRVVAVQEDRVLIGEYQKIYADIGSSKGVRPGDEFRIIRPKWDASDGNPDRPIGLVTVLAVEPKTFMAYVTMSRESIRIGDRIEPVRPTSALAKGMAP